MVANKYGAMDYIKFEHKVTEARWNEAESKWDIKVQGPTGVFDDKADMLYALDC
jgi:cation diffusion facilitator CzcD-associated flavoprotein CzcO